MPWPGRRHLRVLLVLGTLLGVFTAAGGAALPFLSGGDGRQAVPFPSDLPWLNVERPLTLADLRGKVVILDFWTYGCVNCLHVIPDLERLKDKYGHKLAVVAVHSPKFDNEKAVETLRRIVVRYDRTTPVVQDAGHQLWDAYGVRAWPTLVVIAPDGTVTDTLVGEGHYEALDRLVGQLVERHAEALDTGPLPIALEKAELADQPLAFPTKVAISRERVAISDTLHHRVLVADRQGRVQRVFGGAEGFRDAPGERARFRFPRGLAFAPDGLYVADTGNHAIRFLDLESGRVRTVAGSGENERPVPERRPAGESTLSSPWALAFDAPDLSIAMAGAHQVWRLDTRQGFIEPVAGSGREGLDDGPATTATFAQPSGLALSGHRLYVADPEASAVRRIDLRRERVETLIGQGLFTFGDRDGPFAQARLQHALGIAARERAGLLIADTYNHKVKRLDLGAGEVRTLAGTGHPGNDADQLNEPGGIAARRNLVLVADTNNHRVLRLDPATGTLEPWPIRWD